MPYYHGSLDINLESIRRNGLLPQHEWEKRMLSGQVWTTQGGQNAIFATKDEVGAWYWAFEFALEYWNQTGKVANPIVFEISDDAVRKCVVRPDILGRELASGDIPDVMLVGCNISPSFLRVKVHPDADESFQEIIDTYREGNTFGDAENVDEAMVDMVVLKQDDAMREMPKIPFRPVRVRQYKKVR